MRKEKHLEKICLAIKSVFSVFTHFEPRIHVFVSLTDPIDVLDETDVSLAHELCCLTKTDNAFMINLTKSANDFLLLEAISSARNKQSNGNIQRYRE